MIIRGAGKSTDSQTKGFLMRLWLVGGGHWSANIDIKVGPGGLQSILWKKKHPHPMIFVRGKYLLGKLGFLSCFAPAEIIFSPNYLLDV